MPLVANHLPLLLTLFGAVAAHAQSPLPIGDAAGRARALQCLATAIEYEAGNESLDGQRAVAQVIMNRLRHPAYPKTVCGVVFQGSTRQTGCQFTFTCDGSLARPPLARTTVIALAIAESALDGTLPPTVGGATHYHANYVSPYWAPSLVKIGEIGAHIFYRLPGSPDAPASAQALGLSEEPSIAALSSPPPPNRTEFRPWGLSAMGLISLSPVTGR